MEYKCTKCSEIIQTRTDKFVPDGKRYMHFECYIEKAMRNKKTREEATIEAETMYSLARPWTERQDIVRDFSTLIKSIYGETPVYYSAFMQRISGIVSGEYKKHIGYSISYPELIEMYSNQKMKQKLDKIAYSRNIQQDNRLLWDLEVIFNEYPNYLRAKKRAFVDSEEGKEAVKNIQKYKINPSERYKQNREEVIEQNKRSVDINDLVDELLE